MLDNHAKEDLGMTPARQDQQGPVEVFSLIDASMQELLEAIESQSAREDDSSLDSPVDQVADLVLAEAVRLIRLGTRSETASAGSDLANALIGPQAEGLEENHADAFLSLAGASRVLRAASAPSSPGADLTVLRSWNGKALEVVQALAEAPGEELPRSEIRTLLGEVDESYLSHLLADLEAARLIVRVREGRLVTVHLGPVGRTERVRRMLTPKRPLASWSNNRGQMIFYQSTFEKELTFTPMRSVTDPSRLQETGNLGHLREEHELQPKQSAVSWVLADKPNSFGVGDRLSNLQNAQLSSADE